MKETLGIAIGAILVCLLLADGIAAYATKYLDDLEED